MSCGQLCKWNDPAAGCVKPDWEMCLMSNIASPEKPKTNADRIRAMSDYDLSRFLCGLMDAGGCDERCPAANYCYHGHNGMEEWLQKPAEEEK